ncbi:MAG: tannase/feruloyl esterase family alpha/beta hydrolase [Acidimicrobiia bacterium]|nr:tannase/feruloyl esterase family alpha/beta hydrolase [Acidimicrobiia bacterium]
MPRLLVPVLAFVLASPAAAATCEDLTRLAPAHSTVTAATPVPAGAFTPPGAAPNAVQAQGYAALPAFCRVVLTLTPSSDSDIKSEVWLPLAGWNGKLQVVGNGGWAGVIPYPALAGALAAGYAAGGTDTGHVGNNADFVPGHPEKLVDFAHRAIHETTVAAKAVIQAHYGDAPRLSYFNGCSQGGRQALASAQRYPDDFDGIVAGAPAWNSMRMHAARLALNRYMHRSAESAIPAAKYPVIHHAVMQACDAHDGVKDGVIENPAACTFDPQVLACRGGDGSGGDTASCLNPAQVESARAMLSPVKHPATGAVLFEGRLWPGAEMRWDVIGGPTPLGNAVTGLKNVAFGHVPGWTPEHFNLATDLEAADKADGDLLDTGNFDLSPYFASGGKLLVWHGWADPQVTPSNATIYYEGVMKTVGSSAADSLALFMLPGVLHCQGGPGPDRFDRMAAIEQWVELGEKPSRIIASKVTDGKVERTRPLCPYPQVARWNGTGSTDDAANFACVAP